MPAFAKSWCNSITARPARVNQHLFAVEAKPLAVEILWPIDNGRPVVSARLEALHINVPEKESLMNRGLQLDSLHRLDVVLLVEKKQLNSGGMPGEDREIHPPCRQWHREVGLGRAPSRKDPGRSLAEHRSSLVEWQSWLAWQGLQLES
jgi:hypothetical protein